MTKPTLESVLTSPRLPSLPAVALQVIELTRAPNVELAEIADLIQNDQALAAKVLRTVNSSYYGLREPCGTIRQSLNYLGLNTVKSLALGFSLVDSINDQAEVTFDYVDYWRRGMYSAVGARQVAEAAQLRFADEAFLGAMMQDLGMVAMYRALGDVYLQVIDMAGGDHDALLRVEDSKLEFTHAKVGRAIGERWRLPPPILAVLGFHHDPDKAPEKWRSLVRSVALGGAAAAALGLRPPEGALVAFRARAAEWFKIDETAANALLESIAAGAAELARLFKLNTGQAPDVQNLLAEAEDLLIEHEMTLDRVASELRETNSLLQTQMLVDALTGVGNRRCFEEGLVQSYSDASSKRTPLAILVLDVDRFEPICDAHGSGTGDAVLAEVARRLQRQVGQRGLVCRRRGQEFVLLLPGVDRVEAARLAEGLRQRLEAEPMTLPVGQSSGALNINTSVGVAVYESELASLLSTSQRLLNAADQALCAAKAAGRNCVRVFNPSRRTPQSARESAR